MAGLNHEMSRELLWNEYPTDQRGTYFRQFWDIRGFLTKDGSEPDAKKQKDIEVMTSWTHPLGENSARDPEESLGLFMRGELVRRFPNMIVYAATAGGTPRTPTDDHEYPLFSGNLGSDASFYGFESSREDMENAGSGKGTYFVLQEPPQDTRFTWERAATAPDPGEYMSFDVQPAQVAADTLSQPTRVAIFVTAMLPPEAP